MLWKCRMRLNSNKYAFGASSRKFLDFMVSHHGIKTNPEKLWMIMEISPPRSRKEVQHLTRWVIALSPFIASSGKKCLPFFKALK